MARPRGHRRPDSCSPHRALAVPAVPDTGILARNWPTGSMVIWVALLLGFSLVLY